MLVSALDKTISVINSRNLFTDVCDFKDFVIFTDNNEQRIDSGASKFLSYSTS